MTDKRKRACDSCRRRKVKCIEDTDSCENCVSAGLACTYYDNPQKKGPQRKVLLKLKENQRNAQLTTGLTHELGFDPQLVGTFARTPGLLPMGLIESCLEFFFTNVYPSQPVLHRRRAKKTVMSIEHSTEAYCMIVALCAYVMIQANMTVPPELLPRPEMAQLPNISIGHVLVEEAIRVRKGLDYLENPSHLSVLTSWFFYGCQFGLGRDNSAWSYLRCAITQAQLLGWHDEAYKSDPLDSSQRRALYWLLYIAERTYALHKHRPISLFRTIHPPSLDGTPNERAIASGLDMMIDLYKPVDDTFVDVWNNFRTQANPTWIAQVQNQLSDALPLCLDCTESQAVDLRVTQEWLRTVLWQLCVSQDLVSSVATDSSMTVKHPIEISRDLLSMTRQFSLQAMEVHGMGLIEKIFDIACCLTDVVACIPFSPDTSALSPRDCVSQFLTLFSALHGGRTRYLRLLVAKVSEVLPNLPLPQSPNIAPLGSGLGLARSSLEAVPSNSGDELPFLTSSPSYSSTESIRQLAAQTGAQLPFSTSQHSLLQAPASRVEDLSLYDSSAPHSTHSSGSAPASQTGTPESYDSTSQPRFRLPTQGLAHTIPSSHPQHATIQSYQLGINTAAYDLRFTTPGFPVHHSIVFKRDAFTNMSFDAGFT